MKNRLFLLLFFILSLCLQGISQPARQLVQVIVTPDKSDWTYEKGKQAQFQIMVLKNNVPLDGIDVKYRISPELMDAWEEKTVTLKKGVATVKAKRFNDAGFLRCQASVEVDGKTYSSYSTAGFSPEQIKPTTTLPSDFEQFWDGAKADLAKIPINPVLTLMPERCTDKVDVYHVSIDNIKGKIYGILCKPKAEGKYPAILHVPGAGIRPYYGDVRSAEKGIITFQIGIHGIPVNLEQKVYDNLGSGALNGYQVANMDDKDNYYYKRVYLGCVRAVDFIESLDCFNGQDIAVTGGSQGGALSIITAALDSRIDYLAAFYPALSDLTGYLHGRAGGWPHMFKDNFTNKPQKIETSKYYDVVNFARFVKVPGWYSWGYNDNVCPPTSMHAAYNVIPGSKELHLFQETQHWTFPEQQELKNNWLFKKLLK
ncbi:acetyl xylan esterase, family CE7 [Proteiniphilum saccharofermentans]|uniref:Acetyl xylan esterase, family CE7 n=1 Tax=Proteiniphilum saccharofermentans TaxID=1642647 RepID=A0A1R3SR92_9BACT|nr:acetylxylan esterase [Proteiniphilum saccharofermentans]SCD18923.1 acetyl xylan esterase, family CE7 [Proteiniphilum saccharofermentans]SFS70300.1 Cephalosporin-C deacetylase [Porphyromonadaceae bacterium NLAE-zl-C104]